VRRIVVVIAFAAALAPAPAHAWGFAAHRLITARAIELLPAELQPFFTHFRDEFVVRSVDPDLWRLASWPDDPNHFINFGVREFGDAPAFAGLPREYGAALEKFGRARLERTGTLPWRIAEEYGNLRRVFGEFRDGAPYAPSNVLLFSAVLAHYNTTLNFDGQFTGNEGIHNRFERDLIERYAARLTLTPQRTAPIHDARGAAFDIVIGSYQAVGRILEVDSAAARGRDVYDAEYYDRFFDGVRPTVERLLNDAIAATAAFITGAWEGAGKPTPSVIGNRPLEKVKKK
jgi:hypothetical protein